MRIEATAGTHSIDIICYKNSSGDEIVNVNFYVYGFLLVINTNLPPILHRFRDIAVDRSGIAILGYPSCLTCLAEGFPWDDLREIFSGCQLMAKVPNAVEILRKI